MSLTLNRDSQQVLEEMQLEDELPTKNMDTTQELRPDKVFVSSTKDSLDSNKQRLSKINLQLVPHTIFRLLIVLLAAISLMELERNF